LRLERALRNWQLALFLALITLVVTTAALAKMAMGAQVVPYIVEVGPDGSTRYAGPIKALDTTSEALVLHELEEFVWNLRLVSTDVEAQRELITRAFALADTTVRGELESYFSDPENDPRNIAQLGTTRKVENIDALRLPGSKEVFEVRWTERERGRRSFTNRASRNYRALIKATRIADQTPEELLYNPLGIVITEFNWSNIDDSDP
jgi:type IV secretion system protein VirB5